MSAPISRVPAAVVVAVILDIVMLLLGAGFLLILFAFAVTFPSFDISPLLWVLPGVALSTLVLVGIARRWVATPWLASLLALILPCVPARWDPSGLLLMGIPVVAAILLWLPLSRRWLRRWPARERPYGAPEPAPRRARQRAETPPPS